MALIFLLFFRYCSIQKVISNPKVYLTFVSGKVRAAGGFTARRGGEWHLAFGGAIPKDYNLENIFFEIAHFEQARHRKVRNA